jgi:prophage tail gpP-like protein
MPADVHIVIDGQELRDWRSYEIDSDLMQPADAFSFSVVNPAGRSSTRFGLWSEVRVVIDGVVQMTGWVDEITRGSTTDDGSTLTVTGRDRFGQLVDCCAEPRHYHNVSLMQLAQRIASGAVSEWRAENERNRYELLRLRREVAALRTFGESLERIGEGYGQEPLAIAQGVATRRLAEMQRALLVSLKVEPGERVYEVLERSARKIGMMLWCGADGCGIIAKPNYDQSPIYELHLHPQSSGASRQNNIETAEIREDGRDRYSRYRFLATMGNTKADSGTASRARSEIIDDEVALVIDRPLIETGETQKKAGAIKQAEREMQRRRFDSLEITYTVRGHRNRGLLWQQDTLALVADEVNGVNGVYYVVGRRFSGNDRGQTTQVRLRRPGTLLP